MSENKSEILTYQTDGKFHFTSCPYSLQPALKIGSRICMDCEYNEGRVYGEANAIYCSYRTGWPEEEA